MIDEEALWRRTDRWGSYRGKKKKKKNRADFERYIYIGYKEVCT
jgi:hypothetical protein